MNDLLNKINAAKGKQYGSDKRTIDKTAQDAIFKQDLISNQAILNKVESLLNYVVDANKSTPTYDEKALSALLEARWKPSNISDRIAYNAINRHQNWAKKAIESLRKATSDSAEARKVALARFSTESAVINNTSLTTANHIWALMSALNYLNQKEATGTEKTRVLTGLKRIRDNADKVVYNVLKSRIDNAIIQLTGGHQPDDSIQLRKDWEDAEKKVQECKSNLTKTDEEIAEKSRIVTRVRREKEAAEKKVNDIKSVIELVKKEKNILQGVLRKNIQDARINTESITNLFETNIIGQYYGSTGSNSLQRNKIGTEKLINHFVDFAADTFIDSSQDVFKIDLAKMLVNIDANVELTNNQKESAKKALREIDKALKTRKKYGDEYEKKFLEKSGGVASKDRKTLGEQKYKPIQKAAHEDPEVLKYFIEAKIAYGKLARNIILFTTNAFPKNKTKVNPFLIKGNALEFKDKEGISLLGKNHEIIWRGTAGNKEAGKPIGSPDARGSGWIGIRPDSETKYVKFSLSLINEEGCYLDFLNDLFSRDPGKLTLLENHKIFEISGESDLEEDILQYEADFPTLITHNAINAQALKRYYNKIKNIIESANLEFKGDWENKVLKICSDAFYDYDPQVRNVAKSFKVKNLHFTVATAYSSVEDLIKGYDSFEEEAEVEKTYKTSIYDSENEDLKDLQKGRRLDSKKLSDAQKDAKRKKTLWEEAAGLSKEQLIKKFNDIYGKGPFSGSPSLLYSFEELEEMKGLLKEIKSRNAINSDLLDKEKELIDNVWKAIDEIPNFSSLQAWIASRGSVKERVDKINLVGGDVAKKDYVTTMQIALESLEKKRKLQEAEEEELAQIKEYLTGKPSEKPDTPTDLDLASLQTILGVTNLSEAEIKLEEWKQSKNFNTKDGLEEFVKEYRPNGGSSTLFKDFLAKGKVDKFEGDNYWVDFIKKGPKVVIKNILYYSDYETASEAGKKEITDKIKGLHSDYGLDKPTAKQIAQYLYDVKEAIVKTKDSNNDERGSSNEEIKWYDPKGTTGKIVWGGLAFLGAAIAISAFFWDNIKDWWNDTGEKETKKPGKKK